MNLTSSNVTVAGNLTRDPEVKFQVAGQAKLLLAVAVTRRWHDPVTNQWQESTSFLDIVCWGDLAQNVSRSAKRGDRVVVTGRVEQRSWKSKGVARSKTEIVADDVALSVRWATAQVTKAQGPASEPSRSNELSVPADRGGGEAQMDSVSGPVAQPALAPRPKRMSSSPRKQHRHHQEGSDIPALQL